MKILFIDPDKHPVKKNIKNSADAIKKLLDGVCEVIYPFDDPVALVSAADDSSDDRLNRSLPDENGHVRGYFTGPFVVCGTTTDRKNFISLSPFLAEKYRLRFYGREAYIEVGANQGKEWYTISLPLDGPVNKWGYLRKDLEKLKALGIDPDDSGFITTDDPTLRHFI